MRNGGIIERIEFRVIDMKTILLLGGYGFLGTNILNYIDSFFRDKYQVIVFDRYSAHPAGLAFSCVIKTYSGDFSDEFLLRNIFNENHIDQVIHSLSTTIPINGFNAKYDIESNLIPTVRLLDLMVNCGVRDIVYISSGGAVYGRTLSDRHSEDEAVYPISSYGVVKLAIEKYLVQYEYLYGIHPLILRLSNPYGKFHYSLKQGICNVAIDYALNNNILKVWGDGHARKDFIFVEDFVCILFSLLDINTCQRIINIGSGEVSSVNRVLSLIQRMIPSFRWEYENSSRLDVPDSSLNTEVLISLIGNFSFTPLEKGLEQTLEWAKGK